MSMTCITSHSLDFNTIGKADIDWLFDPVRFGLFLGEINERRGSSLEPPLLWPMVAEVPHHPPSPPHKASPR